MQNYTQYDLVKNLNNSKSFTTGTSLITMTIPPNSNLSLTSNQLNNEMSTSHNIKSKHVRLSVQSAIKSAQQQLKLLGHTSPANGIVLCAGEIMSCV